MLGAVCLAHTQVKQFDVDVHWMGRNRSAELKRFSAIPDPGHRLALLREAIQGGSITPEAMDALRPHMQVGAVADAREVAAGRGYCM